MNIRISDLPAQQAICHTLFEKEERARGEMEIAEQWLYYARQQLHDGRMTREEVDAIRSDYAAKRDALKAISGRLLFARIRLREIEAAINADHVIPVKKTPGTPSFRRANYRFIYKPTSRA